MIKKFFLADDDPDDQELFLEALQLIDNRSECETAFNGQEALQKLLHGRKPLPDFIFLDLNMPGMNGTQCLAEIKKHETLQHIPVIIYSTSSDNKDIEDTLQYGAAYFLQKPNRFEELLVSLKKIINYSWK